MFGIRRFIHCFLILFDLNAYEQHFLTWKVLKAHTASSASLNLEARHLELSLEHNVVHINLLAPKLFFFYILAHSLYKM